MKKPTLEYKYNKVANYIYIHYNLNREESEIEANSILSHCCGNENVFALYKLIDTQLTAKGIKQNSTRIQNLKTEELRNEE